MSEGWVSKSGDSVEEVIADASRADALRVMPADYIDSNYHANADGAITMYVVKELKLVRLSIRP